MDAPKPCCISRCIERAVSQAEGERDATVCSAGAEHSAAGVVARPVPKAPVRFPKELLDDRPADIMFSGSSVRAQGGDGRKK